MHRTALLLLALSGCTATHYQALRTNFPPETRLKVTCRELPDDTNALDKKMRLFNEKGWRVSAMGETTTNYFIFVHHAVTACFEKPVDTPD